MKIDHKSRYANMRKKTLIPRWVGLKLKNRVGANKVIGVFRRRSAWRGKKAF